MSFGLSDQADGRTNLARRAVPTLEGVMVDKGLLYRIQHAVFGQAFYGGDLRAVLHYRQRQARIDPATIDQNRAGAALAVIATLLRSGQAEMNSQRVKKSRPWGKIQLFVTPLTLSGIVI